MNKIFLTIVILLITNSLAFSQNKLMTDWGLSFVFPKFYTYHLAPKTLYLPEFGSLPNGKNKISDFTIATDIGLFFRIRKKRGFASAGLNLFNEKFEIESTKGTLSNKFKSGVVIMLRNGINLNTNAGFRLFNIRSSQWHALVGGSLDLVTYRKDPNLLNTFSMLKDPKTETIDGRIFMDKNFTIPKTEVMTGLQFTQFNVTASLIYSRRAFFLGNPPIEERLYNKASYFKLQFTNIIGYKLK